MEIIHSLEQLKKSAAPCVIALGTFDGLHRGHRDVIRAAREYAAAQGEQLAVFTFSNHPLSLISPASVPVPLLTPADKRRCLAELGVDVLLDIPFDERLARLTPLDFLTRLAALRYNCLVVGENFSFGWHGEGNSSSLQQWGRELGFRVIVRPLVSDGATVISSTAIRRLILAGAVAQANKMLGRIHALSGTVIRGEQRGRRLGFPTANVALAPVGVAVPHRGAYAVKAAVAGCEYQGMASIGSNPTFGALPQPRLEVHLFDFHGDLYGQTITVAFYEQLRAERSFASAAELCRQLAADRERCLRYFAGQENPGGIAEKHLPVFP